jgi:hypothetical protein
LKLNSIVLLSQFIGELQIYQFTIKHDVRSFCKVRMVTVPCFFNNHLSASNNFNFLKYMLMNIDLFSIKKLQYQFITKWFPILVIFGISFIDIHAQIITGKIRTSTGLSEPGFSIKLENTEYGAITNANGVFRIFDAPEGSYTLVAANPSRSFIPMIIEFNGEFLDLGIIRLPESKVIENYITDIAVITIDDLEQIDDSDALNISGLLTASRDPFDEAAAFQLSAGRFRARGYELADTEMFLNGMQMNNLSDGRVVWNNWGGLNDVLRSQINSLNLRDNQFAFGGLGGASLIDLRASEQRVQTRMVYTSSNRSYRHRGMLTHSSGMQKNGWAYSFSMSRRLAFNQGFIEGTHYDAYSYFVSIDKKLNDKHTLNFVTLGAPLRRGRSGPAIQEMIDLSDNRFYNPNWGFQNGEVRNTREDRIHQPIITLRHDWQINKNTKIFSTIGMQTGKFGTTRLDWYLAPDPRPDYYRKLPSFQRSEAAAEAVETEFRDNVSVRQVDFDRMFEINRDNQFTIDNVDGIPGNSVSGNLSSYVLEEQRFDNHKLSFNSIVNSALKNNFFFTGGINVQNERVRHFRVLDDLLGGDFYINLDRFAILDFPADSDALQQDIDRPNQVVREGDIFGHNYDIVTNQISSFGQLSKFTSKWDLFLTTRMDHTSFYREGYMRNGRFPNNSFGKSDVNSFLTGSAKAGATFKIDGRNYVYGVGMIGSRAPFSRWAYISPRTRHDVVDGLREENMYSAEAGYVFRWQRMNGRISAYYTEFQNRLLNNTFYHDELRTFVNYVRTGINQRHTGLEFGLNYKLSQTWTLKAAGALQENIFTSRPLATITQDNTSEKLAENRTVYMKNFFVSGSPQTAATLGLSYNSPKFWFINGHVNYFARNFVEANPDRRTLEGVSLVNKDENPALWSKILDQEELPSSFTVDIFMGKSWRYKRKYFIATFLSVSNVLDNKNFITGAFEQFRFDFQTKDVDRFPPRYFYGFGRNYALNVSLSFN